MLTSKKVAYGRAIRAISRKIISIPPMKNFKIDSKVNYQSVRWEISREHKGNDHYSLLKNTNDCIVAPVKLVAVIKIATNVLGSFHLNFPSF